MTGNQVIQAIKLALDKYSASTSAVIGPAFLDEELCAFANQAMVETICTKFTGNNQLQQGFEQSVKRVADLERLIVESTHPLVAHAGNSYVTESASFDDDTKWLFLVSATISLQDKNGNTKFFPAELIDRHTASKFLETPTNKPWIPVPKITTYQVVDPVTLVNKKGVKVYLDSITIANYTNPKVILEYVIQPLDITEDRFILPAFGGVFSDPILYEIINRAALLALDNIESPRVQTKSELNRIQE